MSPSNGTCPTGCGRSARVGHLMCGPCWSLVPKHLQRDVYRTWRAYRKAALAGADDYPDREAEYNQASEAAIASIP